ncbi:SPOR domain-containing protein [Sphingomonas sp. HF-S3]|uniref:SPOR domain-containing protein n=2 Tax=Sphingomonas rustica TaxID=3103142 RepID=A0ABV0B9G5_9SPHN
MLSACGGGYGYGPRAASAPPPQPAAAGSGEPSLAPIAASAPVDDYDPWAEPVRAQPGQDAAGTSYSRPGTRPASAPAPAQDGWRDPTLGAAGPAASSRGSDRYDRVGQAAIRPVEGGEATAGAVVALSPTLAEGSFVEVTSLDTGKTILVLVTGTSGQPATQPAPLIELSPAAARLLGATRDTVAVRVRRSTPTAGDQAALFAGRPAGERPDTPPVLLNALRRQLADETRAAPPAPATTGRQPVRAYVQQSTRGTAPTSAPARSTAPAARGGRYYVQVAALSNAANAQALARRLGGFVTPGGGLNRVQLGPFATAAEAGRGRARAAQAGFGDARVFTRR